MGTVVEQHHIEGLETGYSVEFFDLLGNTIAVVMLPGIYLRSPARFLFIFFILARKFADVISHERCLVQICQHNL
ncbi:MAG: DUF4926 domain-containing protein [Oscillatoriales cyanobacterium]|nr:MAG: DUF4926 domain-containing protein [Oscillatoriales cyanobacterium]